MQRDNECQKACQYAKTRNCEPLCARLCRYVLHREPTRTDRMLAELGITLDLDRDYWSSAATAHDFYTPEVSRSLWGSGVEEKNQYFGVVRDRLIKSLNVGHKFLEPGYGSSVDSLVMGPTSATAVRAQMEEWLETLKDQKMVNNFSIGSMSSWTCVDYKVDKRKRIVSLFWERTDAVGFRTTREHHYRRMSARAFKRLIRRAQRSVGSDIMDVDFSIQPVQPVKFIQFQINFDYDLYEKQLTTQKDDHAS